MENLFASRVGEPRKYSSPVTRPLLLLSMLLVSILVFPGSMQAQTLPPLGTAVNFGILGSTAVSYTHLGSRAALASASGASARRI